MISVATRDLLGIGLRAGVHLLGRMTMDFGSRRLVARNRFKNVANSFDGIHTSSSETARPGGCMCS